MNKIKLTLTIFKVDVNLYSIRIYKYERSGYVGKIEKGAQGGHHIGHLRCRDSRSRDDGKNVSFLMTRE